MLETLRRASKSWVAAIFIGLLVLSFAIWGINDIFKGGASTRLAKVGNAELDVRTFENEYAARIRRQTNERGQPMTAAEGRANGYDRIVLDAMISELAVLEEARRQKLAASDAMVRKALGDIPGILAPDGSIDRQALAGALQNAGYTETEFLTAVRSDLMRSQLLQTAAIGSPAPRGMGLALQAYANERRVLEYVVLPAEKAGEIAAPDDAALQAYLEANAATYTAPELRGITVLSVGPKDLLANIEVTDDAIKAQYDAQKKRYETIESRELQQIVYPTKEEAEAAKAKLTAGKTFDDLAAEKKLKLEDMALGTIQKGDPGVPAGAFDVAEGEVSAPLEGPFGWALIKVLKINAGSTKALDEVRAEIHDELAMEQALDQIAELVNKMQDELAANDGLEDVAKAMNLTPRVIPAIDAQGRDADGKPIEKLPDGPDFLTDVFAIEQGERTDVIETPEHVLYAVHVDSVTPTAVRPLAAIREKVAAAWTAAEQAKKLKALAEDVVTRANAGGTSLADVAKELGLEAATSEPLARDGLIADLSPEFLATLFATKQNVWVAGAGGEAPRTVVARVKEITRIAPEDALADERAVRTAETRVIDGDLQTTYREAIVAATPVEIDQTLYEQTRRQGQ